MKLYAICIAKILPFGSLPEEEAEPETAQLNAFVDAWTSRLENLVSDHSSSRFPLVLVDMNRDFGDEDLDDGVHPTKEGAEKMAEKWFACIASF